MKRRGTGPITSSLDRSEALAEIRAILADDPVDADRQYVRAVFAALEVWEQYCDEGCDKPSPFGMLSYQIEVVKQTTTEAVAVETGIADIDKLLNATRAFTDSDISVLSHYFGIAPEHYRM